MILSRFRKIEYKLNELLQTSLTYFHKLNLKRLNNIYIIVISIHSLFFQFSIVWSLLLSQFKFLKSRTEVSKWVCKKRKKKCHGNIKDMKKYNHEINGCVAHSLTISLNFNVYRQTFIHIYLYHYVSECLRIIQKSRSTKRTLKA